MKHRLQLVTASLAGIVLLLLLPTAGRGADPSADLRVTISGPSNGEVGQTLVYSVSVTNAGPTDADDVVATFTAPSSQFADATVRLSRGGCAGLECRIGTMPPGSDATGTLTVRVVAKQQTIIGLSARSSTPDPAQDSNSAAILVFGPAPPPGPAPGPDPGVPALQPELPLGIVGRPYRAAISVTGGGPPYRFFLGGCDSSRQPPPPPGFTVSREGVVEFTPTVAGNWGICFIVSDSYRGGRSFRGLKTVLRVRELLVIRKPASAMTGAAYESPFVSGGQAPYRVTFEKGALPRGLRETDMWTRLVGRPLVSGTFAFGVTVEDSLGQSASASHVLRVRVGPNLPLRANEQLTPGRITGRKPLCTTSSVLASTVSASQRSRLLAAYGVWWKPSLYVIDHLITVELGGHPTHSSNLWPQLAERAKQTDVLERMLLRQVCSGATSLRSAQERLKRHKLNVG